MKLTERKQRWKEITSIALSFVSASALETFDLFIYIRAAVNPAELSPGQRLKEAEFKFGCQDTIFSIYIKKVLHRGGGGGSRVHTDKLKKKKEKKR